MPSKDRSQYAPKAWADIEYEFELPSGDKCLLRKLDPLALGEHGLLDKLDFATSVVMNTHAKNANLSNVERIKRDRAKRDAKARGEEYVEPGADEASLLEIAKSADNSKAFREVMNQLLVLGVSAPEMHLPPEDPAEERDDEWFYVDAVPFGDKMAVFNKLMEGVRTTEQFREGPEENVGDVAPEPSVRPAAKRVAGATRKRSAR